MKFSVFQVSRLGGRSKNEDRMGYCYSRDAALFLLADGMGGHPDGEVAAQMALQSMAMSFQRTAKTRVADPLDFLGTSLIAAHHAILRYAAGRGLQDSPRTTLVAVLVQDGVAYWVHCGDSRLYVVREGELFVRTRDHSFIEHKDLTTVPVDHINRNVLFTCLGSGHKPVYDLVGPETLVKGDKLLLCSDGLWDHVNEQLIVKLLAALPVSQAVPELVERALRQAGGSSDNVTALALEWETSPTSADGAESSVTSTDHLLDGNFESTIEPVSGAAPGPLSGDDLDDDAIERTIAEINEAIRRTATLTKQKP